MESGGPSRTAGPDPGRPIGHGRLCRVLFLTASAAAALAAASAGMPLADGTAALLRNLAGLVGIALLTATALGGALSWTAPTAYLVLGCAALYQAWHGTAWTTPWLWPSRPPHDTGAAIAATTVLAVGLLAITVLGPRESDAP